MTAPVVRAARSGIARRRVQSIVIGLVVLVSTAASAPALGLLVDYAFAAQRGAHVTATVDSSRASAAQLAATTRLPEVAAATGPFPIVTVTGQATFPDVAGVFALPPLTLSGRPSPGGPVDDITLDQGRWARAPGEIVVSRDLQGPSLNVGQQITVTGVPGSPRLTVVGIAKSITDSAAGWVTPGEVAALRGPGGPVSAQLLYRFRAAGTALRAGRLSAVQAIATGRAPRPHRGYAANRLLGPLPLPRPLTIGLAAPFARPSRSLITMTSVLLGSTAVIFAVGLSTSLSRASADLSHAQSEPVQEPHRPRGRAHPAARPGGRARCAQHGGPGHPGTRARSRRVQGPRHDPAAGHRDGAVVRRRGWARRRVHRGSGGPGGPQVRHPPDGPGRADRDPRPRDERLPPAGTGPAGPIRPGHRLAGRHAPRHLGRPRPRRRLPPHRMSDLGAAL